MDATNGDALTAAERIVSRAYRRHCRRDTFIRVGLWIILPGSLWVAAIALAAYLIPQLLP